jgi:DNA segregation ATPase FtsK/SpoIIIE-like protein
MDWLQGGSPYAGLATPAQSVGFPAVQGLPDVLEVSPVTMLGVNAPGDWVSVDLDAESPHVLVNAATGAGKSTVARSMAVQRLVQGDQVVILDRKMHSHRWARQLAPVVHYADTVPGIAATLFNLGRELHRRNLIVRDWQGPVETAPVGPRIVTMFEEMSASLSQLKDLDKQVKPGNLSAFDALLDVLMMGRAVRMHMIGFAQLASYRSGMSQDLLENFGHRILIDYSDKAWKWLAADCGRYRVAPSEKGRGMVCSRGRAVETQLCTVSEPVAAERVLSALPAQRMARSIVGGRTRDLPPVWRTAIGS